MAKTLRPTKAPNLIIARPQYEMQQQELFKQQLRQYFDTIDNYTSALMQNNGGRFLNFPHIAAQDTTDQYATATNTATIVKWNQLDSASGFTLNLDSTATASYSGIYKIDYSLQLANTDNAIHNTYVWLQVDGVDVPGSASKFTLAARKGVGNPALIVAYSSVTFEIEGDQSVGLWWATDQAYSTTGPVDGIFMEYEAAQTSPFARPSVPSAIGSIVFVSELDQ